MKKVIFLLILYSIIGCSGKVEDELTEADIDKYVTSKLESSQIYDIAQSLRFSKENEAYTVVTYEQNDSTILVNEEIEYEDKMTIRNIFYKDDQPIFIEEYDYPYFEDGNFVERKIYLHDDVIIQAYKKESNMEDEMEFLKFVKIECSDEFDFQRPFDAINQQGDYEMRYGEFLIIEPQRYLILENSDSKYNVALFIMEGDMLIEELYEKPELYLGKTIFIHHEFLDMNGIERMIYRGGIVKQ